MKIKYVVFLVVISVLLNCSDQNKKYVIKYEVEGSYRYPADIKYINSNNIEIKEKNIMLPWSYEFTVDKNHSTNLMIWASKDNDGSKITTRICLNGVIKSEKFSYGEFNFSMCHETLSDLINRK